VFGSAQGLNSGNVRGSRWSRWDWGGRRGNGMGGSENVLVVRDFGELNYRMSSGTSQDLLAGKRANDS